jgi:hypothetical protein
MSQVSQAGTWRSCVLASLMLPSWYETDRDRAIISQMKAISELAGLGSLRMDL